MRRVAALDCARGHIVGDYEGLKHVGRYPFFVFAFDPSRTLRVSASGQPDAPETYVPDGWFAACLLSSVLLLEAKLGRAGASIDQLSGSLREAGCCSGDAASSVRMPACLGVFR